MKQEHFEKLFNVNVNEHTENKNGLTYLTWSWAWAELKKIYPDATYEIEKFEGLPYVYDEQTGYMVFTKVTIEETTYEMWLPVMDGSNKAMKNKPYEYKTKYGTKSVEAATMFDINKTIMRCLVKNLAMFGLGLYIYSGEDLPEVEDEIKGNKTESKKTPTTESKATPNQLKVLEKAYTGDNIKKLLELNKIDKLEDLSITKASELIGKLAKKKEGK